MPSVFLSHNSKDKPFARRIAASLKAAGITVWLDEAEMLPGDSLIGKVEQAILDVDYLAVILSRNSITSEWVLRETRIALHREISGKNVVVVPLLLDNCPVPPFLQDKIYADFRRKQSYDVSVHKLIKRFERDDDEATTGVLELVDDAPFTRLWRMALETRNFSDRFSNTLHTTLVEISSEEKDQWSPQVAASYLLFLAEIKKGGSLDKKLWLVLCSLIEDRWIRTWLRHTTLAITLPFIKEYIARDEIRLPRLFDNGISDPLAEYIVSSYLDTFDNPKAKESISILVQTWELGDRPFREGLVMALESWARSQYRADEVFQPLRRMIDLGRPSRPEINELFNRIRFSWLRNIEASDGADPRQLASKIIDTLSNQKSGSSDRSRLLDLYRKASRQEEVGDFGLYTHLVETLNVERLEKIRRKQGDAFTFDILADIVLDPDVEVTISTLALGFIFHEGFGSESLLLNDNLLPSLLQEKRTGQNKMSVVDALCHSIDNDEDMWSANLLIHIHSVLNEEEKASFMLVIKSRNTKRAQAIQSYLGDKIDLKTLKKHLK